MSLVSVLIPARAERYLARMVDDLLEKAAGEVEIITVSDGPTPYPLPAERTNVRLVQLPEPLGMRHGINLAASLARGKYLMKIDGHCSISAGYDVLLQACEDNWVVIGRRNELNAEQWAISDATPCDYWYMSNPWTSGQGYMRDCRWISRQQARMDVMLDETMTMSGSMWFMAKRHFERIGGMDDARFGMWCGEPQELACKTWLSGGKLMVNKAVVYAHLRAPRDYHIAWKIALRGLRTITEAVKADAWPGRIYDFGWLVDHFWPLPLADTRVHGEKYFWEPDWREKYYHA